MLAKISHPFLWLMMSAHSWFYIYVSFSYLVIMCTFVVDHVRTVTDGHTPCEDLNTLTPLKNLNQTHLDGKSICMACPCKKKAGYLPKAGCLSCVGSILATWIKFQNFGLR